MNTIIRQLTLADLPYIYDICLKTGNNGKDASNLFMDPYMIGHYYAAPYLFYEIDVCFAAVNNDNEYKRPSGYIIGTSDSASFYEWFYSSWIPHVQLLYPRDSTLTSPNEKRILEIIYEKDEAPDSSILKDYPAHLHIDLLSELQGRGAGKLLMKTFFEKLQKKQCKGLHLGVAKANEHAVGFYKKLGFSILEESQYSFLLGLKF